MALSMTLCLNSAKNSYFKFLQGSVATLFRWSWKILSYFVANLSQTLHINFYQNRSSIVEVMIKKFWCVFYASQCISPLDRLLLLKQYQKPSEKNNIVDAGIRGCHTGYFNVDTIHTASCLSRSTDDMTAFTLYSAFTFAFTNQLLAFL